MKEKKIYCFDLDGTLCNQAPSGDYKKAIPYRDMINHVNDLHFKGNKIIIFTARGSRTGIDWKEVTQNQLSSWGVAYDELILNQKPHFDIMIDDKAVSAYSYRAGLKNEKMRKALADIRRGRPVIVVDDYNRENEGDLVLSAENVNVDNLTFMLRHAGGLMCLPCTSKYLERLEIPMMPSNSRDEFETPFTVSIDAVNGTTTGMSIEDRLKTILCY